MLLLQIGCWTQAHAINLKIWILYALLLNILGYLLFFAGSAKDAYRLFCKRLAIACCAGRSGMGQAQMFISLLVAASFGKKCPVLLFHMAQ